MKNINSSIIRYHKLDIGCKSSIHTFQQYMKTNYNGFDVLVQNAAIADHTGKPEETIDINFWGTLNMMKAGVFRKLESDASIC